MKKIALFLTFFLLFVQNCYAKNVEDVFSDIKSDYPYLKELQTLYDKGIIKESKDALFKPNSLIQRDEFTGIVTEVSCTKCIKPETAPSLIDKYTGTSPFFDLAESNENFYCIAEAFSNGTVKGYDKGYTCSNGISKDGESPFCPENYVTREEALAILLRNSSIYSSEENALLKKQIMDGVLSKPIGNDVFPKKSGTVNTFYGYFLKGTNYEFEDKIVDSNGKIQIKKYKIVEPNEKGNYRPEAYITKQEYIRMAFVVFKSNSCNFDDALNSSIASSIIPYDFSCDENKSCKISDLTGNATIYDFKANYKVVNSDANKVTSKWVFNYLGNTLSGYDQILYGDYVDNYNFRDKSGKLLEGKWAITLIVKDDKGNVSTSGAELYIKAGNNLPKIDIKATPIAGVGPLKVDFSGIGGDSGTKYEWDFGDGNTAIGKNVENLYKESGTYRATLRAISKDGTVTESYVTIKVYDKNDVKLSGKIKAEGKGDNLVDFDYDGDKTGVTTYKWDFGDGTTSTEKDSNIGHKFPGPGTYLVTLEITRGNGDKEFLSYYVTIGSDGKLTNGDFTDSDGDGIVDRDDLCPLVKGVKSNKGCPIISQSCSVSGFCSSGYTCDSDSKLCVKDSDGDGFSDTKDKCPTFPGKAPNGCPDSYSSCFNAHYSKVVGATTCTTCPCNVDIKFDDNVRECDVLFPTILSKDGKDIFSKGDNFEIKE